MNIISQSTGIAVFMLLFCIIVLLMVIASIMYTNKHYGINCCARGNEDAVAEVDNTEISDGTIEDEVCSESIETLEEEVSSALESTYQQSCCCSEKNV